MYEHEVKAWLAGCGVAVPRGVVVGSVPEIPQAGGDLRPPLVVKAYGPGLVHKSDQGAVVLDLPGTEAAASAAREIAERLDVAGFLVEEQAPPGVELIVGVVRDPAFGPVVMAGLGGIWTEALDDTALRLAPVTHEEAQAMLRELRAYPVLAGSRGRPGVHLDALTGLIVAVSASLDDDVAEFELNPVIASPSGAVGVDARLVRGSPPPGTRAADTRPVRGSPPPGTRAAEARLVRNPAPSRRPATDPGTDFGPLFHPRKVAVVGASTSRPGFGNMFLGFYRAAGTPLVAVHPDAAEIDGVPAVPDLASSGADYALVAVPAERCAAVVEAASVPFVQVMSGGFAETGPDGARLEAGLVAAARTAGSRLLGPNCMGVYCPSGGQTFVGGPPGRPGRIAVVSQSGGMAGEIIRVGERRGLAYSKVVTVGNSADVTPAELVRYLATDPETAVLGLYLEDPRDGRGLYDALRTVDLPAVALVGGRSAQGRTAAVSHTGGMVGDARVWAAVSAQTGLALVTSQDDLIGALDALDLHAGRSPAGDGVLVIGPSGGASVLAADAFDRIGAHLPALPDACRDDLRGLGLGAGSSLANPLEIPAGPRGRPELVGEATAAILRHRAYPDVVLHLNVQSFVTYGGDTDALLTYAQEVAAAQGAHPDTRVTLVLRNGECAPHVEDEARAIARRGGVPTYRTMESAATALAALRTARTRVDPSSP